MGTKRTKYSLKNALHKITETQHGYFTARQAIEAGYVDNSHAYHVKSHNWQKVSTGLYRLDGYPDSMESDFTKLCLWSRNQQDQPQGIISHESALAFHGLEQYDPDNIHISVPPRFRKKNPGNVTIHKQSLTLSEIESHGAFMVTRLSKTLSDMKPELEKREAFASIAKRLHGEERISQEEVKALGIIQSKDKNAVSVTLPGKNTDMANPATSGHKQSENNLSQNRNKFDPVSQGVWQMIFNKTEERRRRSRAGFTLVELLVVIAIISILAAMLMPALGKAMESAREIRCRSNQQQLGLTWSYYADDHGMYMPSQDNYCRYWLALNSYLDVNATNNSRVEIYKCPMEIDQTLYSYATNWYLVNRRKSAGGYERRTVGLKPENVEKPSQKLLMMDGEVGWSNVEPGAILSLNGGVAFRHCEEAVYLFFDNHIGRKNLAWTIDDPELNWYIK